MKKGATIELPDELIAVDIELRKIKERKKVVDANSRKLEKDVKALEAKFGTAIGENEAGRLSNGIIYNFPIVHRAAQEAVHYRQLKREDPKVDPLRGTNEKPGRRRRRKSG